MEQFTEYMIKDLKEKKTLKTAMEKMSNGKVALNIKPEESKWYPTRRKSPRVDLTKLTSRLQMC